MVRMPTTMDILLPAQIVVGSRTPIVDENRSVTYKIPASLNRIKACPHRKYTRHFDVGKPRKAPDLITKNYSTYCFYRIYML